MSAHSLIRRIRTLLEAPTAPFREQWACSALDQLLAEIPGLQFESDAFGNRIARIRKGNPTGVAATFVAHLDHPGFLFTAPDDRPGLAKVLDGSKNRVEATFEGLVDDEFFAPGSLVRLYRHAHDEGIPAAVVEATPLSPLTDNRRVILEAMADPADAVLGMWDVEPCVISGDRVYGRACDDLVGAAVLVEALDRLSREKDVDVAAIFSRAEEAGFCGVLCLLEETKLPRLIPDDSVFVSIEISSERPDVRLGDGAVIRIGDKSTTFDGAVADALRGLVWRYGVNARRALMDGGTCEATAFARAGRRAGGICAPVRHYHNMHKDTRLVGPEIVDLTDAEALVDLTQGLARAFAKDRPADDFADTVNDFELYLNKGRRFLAPIPVTLTEPAQIVAE
ncbi:MAG: M20/M25/M40 family metallo-hydrolase [Sumerlaeia bacterium]